MVDAGRKAVVNYIGRLTDGTEFDNSYKNGQPLTFIVGSRQVIPGFDKAVSEMAVGEKRRVLIPAAEAYGAYDEKLVETVPLEGFPNAEQLPVGEYIVFSTPAGPMRVKVVKIEDGLIHFDHNHQLAGQDLDFELELVEVPGVSGSLIENELYNTGTCDCGCDELREQLGGTHPHDHHHHHIH
ncbi:MAG: peptidylprolyl isomerase [Coriobacteriales bacterium]|jgi:FKBP-type peptidyl-prolyl cis-trans isomerase 2|nr:peptidylprolyl isomerase [Coriobacteriales bacterium]